jgi:hypothetical protein
MMQPPPQCAQCAAPLPHGAPKCGFCGLVTPWGAAIEMQQRQIAAHQQQQQALLADRERRLRINKAESSAKTGMILALVGLPICCAPLSIAGGIIGYRAGKSLQDQGQGRPTTALIAMIAAGLSVITFSIAIVLGVQQDREREARLAEIRARIHGKRESAQIEPSVACGVVEEYLVQKGYDGTKTGLSGLHCDGALTIHDRRASLPDVRFAMGQKQHTVNVCLERRARWFVLQMKEGGSCDALPPPALFTPPPRLLSEKELEADEQKMRDSLPKPPSR